MLRPKTDLQAELFQALEVEVSPAVARGHPKVFCTWNELSAIHRNLSCRGDPGLNRCTMLYSFRLDGFSLAYVKKMQDSCGSFGYCT